MINLRPNWLPLLLLVPLLYGLGWVMAAPFRLFGIDPEQHALIGTGFSFLLLLMLLLVSAALGPGAGAPG